MLGNGRESAQKLAWSCRGCHRRNDNNFHNVILASIGIDEISTSEEESNEGHMIEKRWVTTVVNNPMHNGKASLMALGQHILTMS